MFKTVICSKDSFDNEIAATDRLGWVMGDVLRDLGDDDALEIIDFSAPDAKTLDKLNEGHRAARIALPPEMLRTAISAGDAASMEFAKAQLLRPILNSKSCVLSGAPNSINTWIPRKTPERPHLDSSLSRLAEPSVLAARVCRPAGVGTTESQRGIQQQVQDEVEAPLIPDLVASEGEFAGPRGFEQYLRRLEPVRDAYKPANDVLRNDWLSHRDNLRRLRRAAEAHLWEDLHGYWLPRIVADGDRDASVMHDFNEWIRRAVTLKPIARLLTNKPVKIALPVLGTGLGSAASHFLGGVPFADELSGMVGTAAGSYIAQSDRAKRVMRSGRLAMFYQSTKR